MQFQINSRKKTGEEIPRSSRLELLEINVASSDAEENTSGPENRGATADLLLLRKLLAICQMSKEPSFLELTDSCFISM